MKANTEFDDTWQGPTYEFLKAFVGQTVGIHQQYNAEHSLRRTLRGRNCVGNYKSIIKVELKNTDIVLVLLKNLHKNGKV